VKRSIDLLFALIALIFALGPGAFLLVIAKIQFKNGLFIQTRIGKNNQPFSIYKIQSLGPNHELSSFWEIIRSFGLDEIPQLWNIIRGDMSWVGPRPLLPEYLEWYTPEQRRRHEVIPGIFGLSQLHQMQKVLSWEERLALDVEYVNQKSSWLDSKILLKSVFILLTKARKNASDFERMNA
jgi:lipopolysaccharide/colanic/teichoic acid biosynthesis glycosyltransferase